MDLQIFKTIRDWQLTERAWFNAVWFQSTWFACVLGRDSWIPAALALIALHFVLVPQAASEARRLAPLVLAGVGVDGALSLTGVFDFGPGVLLPAWLLLLWVAFATTLNRSLAVFGRFRWLAAAVGGVAVPFNYAVGAKFGAVSFPMTPITTAAILIPIWAILLPSLYRWAVVPTAIEEIP